MADNSDVRLKPMAWVLIILVVLGLIGLGLYQARDWIFPPAGDTAQFDRKDVGGGRKRPDATGVTTVKEYKFVRPRFCPRSKAQPPTRRCRTTPW